MKKKTNNTEIINALFTVIEEFENKPVKDKKVNSVLIEILSDRIEILINK